MQQTADYEPHQQIVREIRYENGNGNGNGSQRIIWSVASFATLLLLTICGVALAKVYELGERVTRAEALIDIMLNTHYDGQRTRPMEREQ